MTTETLEQILKQLSTLSFQRRLYLNDSDKSDKEVIKLLQADIAILELSSRHLGKMVIELLKEKYEQEGMVEDIINKLRKL